MAYWQGNFLKQMGGEREGVCVGCLAWLNLGIGNTDVVEADKVDINQRGYRDPLNTYDIDSYKMKKTPNNNNKKT